MALPPIQGTKLTDHDHKGAHQQGEPISGKRLLLAFGLWLALAVILGGGSWLGVSAIAPAWKATDGPVLLIVAEVYLAMPIALLLVFGGGSGLRTRLGFHFTSASDLLLAVGVEVLVLAATALLYLMLSPWLGPLQGTVLQVLRTGTDMRQLPSADALALVLIVGRAVLLSALAEELFYRGALFGWIRQRLPATATILVTAVLFGVQHASPVLGPYAFLYGIGAGWVRERTGSTLNTLVMHMLNDGFLLTIAALLVAQHLAR
jgi:membrane protease YdiL (CAAX protease family)